MKRQRAKGFFAAFETEPLQPRGILLGQEHAESCVAACCRMLLIDEMPATRHDHRYAESYLRDALKTDRAGTTISRIPSVLRNFGLASRYVYRAELTLEELAALTARRPAIAFVRLLANPQGAYHALLVDQIEAEKITVRDPLPERLGTAYAVGRADFLAHWRRRETGCGRAVTVLG